MTVHVTLAVLAAVAVVGAGCGGDDQERQAQTMSTAVATTPDGATPMAPAPADRAEVEACLREQGVELPSRDGGPPSGRPPAPDPALMEALQACSDELPGGAVPGPPGGQGDVPD